MVFRLKGTNAEEGKNSSRQRIKKIIVADELLDAAEKIPQLLGK